MPKLSVIVPIYGVEKYIERCCASIFEQTSRDFEVIFVNDCSPDKSEDLLLGIINKYQSSNIPTQLLTHTVNRGISAARETGLAAAVGDYIIFVDSDDYLALNMFELLLAKALETDADLVYCDFFEIKGDEPIYIDQSLKCTDSIDITAAMLRQKIKWTPWNKIFKHSLALNHDIHWPTGINIGEDLVVMTKVFAYSKNIQHVPSALYFYNRDNVNSYLNKWSAASCRQNTAAVECVSQFLDNFIHDPVLNEPLIQIQLMARFQMLFSFDKELLGQVADTFPNTNKSIFSYAHAPFYWRVAMFFVAKKLHTLAAVALKIIKGAQVLRAQSSGV
jgi:glycosyltransferase involved in cell wall biosynthesis